MSVVTQDIMDIVQNQQRWRRQECINLIASENVQSPAVQQIEGNVYGFLDSFQCAQPVLQSRGGSDLSDGRQHVIGDCRGRFF